MGLIYTKVENNEVGEPTVTQYNKQRKFEIIKSYLPNTTNEEINNIINELSILEENAFNDKLDKYFEINIKRAICKIGNKPFDNNKSINTYIDEIKYRTVKNPKVVLPSLLFIVATYNYPQIAWYSIIAFMLYDNFITHKTIN